MGKNLATAPRQRLSPLPRPPRPAQILQGNGEDGRGRVQPRSRRLGTGNYSSPSYVARSAQTSEVCCRKSGALAAGNRRQNEDLFAQSPQIRGRSLNVIVCLAQRAAPIA